MSEKENRMLDLLGELPDDILDEAAAVETREEFERLAEPKRRVIMTVERWKIFGVVAACFFVLVSISGWWIGKGAYGGSREPGCEGIGEGSNVNGEMTTAAGFPEGGQTPTEAPGAIENLRFGFGGQIYVAAAADDGSTGAGQSEAKVSELSEDYKRLGSLAWTEEDPGNMETGIERLVGCEVYGASEYSVLYVKINGEYWLFRVE